MEKIRQSFDRYFNWYKLFRIKLRNRVPERLTSFTSKKILPYLALILIAAFTLIADYAQAADNSYSYQYSEDVMDLTPADIAQVISVVGPYTTSIEEDPVTVALAMEDTGFIQKDMVADTQVTQTPKSDVKRSKNINYTVEDGDTIAKIAWTYGLKISTIKTANNLRSDTIRPGQKLVIPPQDLSASQIASLSQKKVAGARVAFGGTFRRPTSGWHISQVFGHTSYESNHTGIDLDSRSGTTIFASASGTVTLHRGWGGGYGNHITISHGGGFSTLYGHMSSFSVANGQWVNQGQPIGIMGSTGWSTGTHLHFEIRINGRPVNPLGYL